MNFLISQNLGKKFPSFASRLVSSLAVIENSSNFLAEHGQNLIPFDPFHFFREHRKSGKCSVRVAKVVHTQLLKSAALHSNIFVANSLLDWYCKYAGMVDALLLFDTMARPNVISWNILISGCNQDHLFEDSWKIFCRMHSLGFEPNEITYGSVLSACTAFQVPIFGKQVYSLAMKNGFFSNGYVRAGMIDLFSKNCSFEDALRVFHDVFCENVVCWNAIISGAVKNGENRVALDLFHEMCCGSFLPNSYTFSSILGACAALEELDVGKGVQGWVIKCGAGDVFVETAIVDLYAKCGLMEEAVEEFLQMPIRNVVSWTTVISGFVQTDDSTCALKFFKDMRELGVEINNYTVTSVVTACAKLAMIEEAIQVHSWILKAGFYSDAAVGAALINMYSKIGEFDLSMLVFKDVGSLKNPVVWVAMISASAQNQNPGEALEIFRKMLQESVRLDKFCISSLLSVIGCLNLGRQIHCYTLKTRLVSDVSVGSALLTMYSKSGSLEESHKVFEQILERDNVSWASMIAGFAEHGCADQAIKSFGEMLLEEIVPDQMTLTATLTACSALRSLQKGKEIHGYALRIGVGKDVVVGGALVTMYSKCGTLELAKSVFDMLPQKDQVARSSLTSGYAQNGYIEKALMLFFDMLMADLAIDSFTVSSVLGAIALLNRSDIGTQMHALITKMGLDSDVSVGSSLVTMYSKCGSIEECRKAFDQIEKPDLIGWTAMIVSYAQHGKGTEALSLYDLMRKEGIKPDSVTFVGVLSACSHNGLVEEAYIHLNSMVKDHGIEPGYRHYACMIDLLGRSGRLKEAESFINDMPIKPDALVWGTLLAACKVHGDIELGKLAAKKVMELEPCDAGAYVSFSNICADVGQWEEVLKIRSLMKGTGVKKEPGWSFV
ncbi:hypothetical protein I3843_11G042900 [Carya illinoinensis]|nr:hypothetical protein I3843_11G042900 [Carya illinoinensis]KAG7954882.1 hypothetical protein I3843_11G042900 [Carya illinoinensis]